MITLTAARLRELLEYDSDTGIFRWKVSRRCVKAGDVAGNVGSDGYRLIGVDGRKHLASRLAWLYVKGCWPNCEIDHKNTIPGDDRFDNLRDVTHAMNTQNERQARRNNQTGLLGASQDRGRFAAHITVDGKSRYLGSFATAEAAHAAYVVAKRKFHEGCTI